MYCYMKMNPRCTSAIKVKAPNSTTILRNVIEYETGIFQVPFISYYCVKNCDFLIWWLVFREEYTHFLCSTGILNYIVFKCRRGSINALPQE